jgi:small nuclear ribonucleoprotein (snRNP)-like protein
MNRKETGTTTKKTPNFYLRSLAHILKYLVDVPVTVEAKDGRHYQGILSAADQNLALTLVDVTVTTPPPSRHQKTTVPSTTTTTTTTSSSFELVHVRGSLIRYLHLPSDIDVAALIKAGQQREQAARQKYQRGVRRGPSSSSTSSFSLKPPPVAP